MTNGGVDRSVECTSHMIYAFESVMMYSRPPDGYRTSSFLLRKNDC
ncbi:hypothetical protein HanPI659440_Chr17g0673641 [Helianthus annuus]|nr:hypothetical protein HanPI659440_Chr17g0673641 [Helianthus annuus]